MKYLTALIPLTFYLSLTTASPLSTSDFDNTTHTLSERTDQAIYGWVAWYNANDHQCLGTSGRVGESDQIRDTGCYKIAPTTDTIGVYWGYKVLTVDRSFSQMTFYVDDACTVPSGLQVQRPPGWKNGNPMACFSAAAFKPLYGGGYRSFQLAPWELTHAG